MSRKTRELKNELTEALELAGIAVDLSKDMGDVTKDALGLAERASSTAAEAIAFARERSAYASGVIAMASAVNERAGVRRATEVLSGEELQAFAEVVPQWSVSTGFTGGTAVKTYKRIIARDELPPERRRGGERENETYRSLADYEHSDIGLAQIFDTYGFVGDYVNGQYYEISFSSEEQGPITYGDLARVLDAESYLIAERYVVPVEQEEVKV